MAQQLFTCVKKILPFLGIGLFIYLIYTLDIGKILNAIQSIPPHYLLASLLLTIPVVLLRNFIWMMIHKQQHIHITFISSLKIFLIGYFYGTITPGYLGQLMRVPYMKEKTREPYGKLFVNTFLETTLHTFSLYLMMVVGGFFLLQSQPMIFGIVCIWVILICFLLVFFVNKKRGELFFHMIIRYLVPKSGKQLFTRFVDTFSLDFPNVRFLVLPCLLGALTWVLMFSQYYLIILGLGVSIPFFAFLLLFPVANTAGFIPVTFAGLGTREFTAIVVFSSLFAVTQEQVFVFILLGFVITDVFAGFCGFLLSLTETNRKTMKSYLARELQ